MSEELFLAPKEPFYAKPEQIEGLEKLKMSEVPERNGFGCGDKPNPRAFIQYKGTDICMDFYCECGAHCHFDGYFAYTVKCPHCQAIWEMPFNIYPRKVCSETYEHWRENPQILEPDEDFEGP